MFLLNRLHADKKRFQGNCRYITSDLQPMSKFEGIACGLFVSSYV